MTPPDTARLIAALGTALTETKAFERFDVWLSDDLELLFEDLHEDNKERHAARRKDP